MKFQVNGPTFGVGYALVNMTRPAISLLLGLFLSLQVAGCRPDCEDLADVCERCPEARQKEACEFVVAQDDADFCDAEIEDYADAGCQ